MPSNPNSWLSIKSWGQALKELTLYIGRMIYSGERQAPRMEAKKARRRSLSANQWVAIGVHVEEISLSGLRIYRRVGTEKPGSADFTWNRRVRGTAGLVGFSLAYLEQLIEPKSSQPQDGGYHEQ